MIRFADGKPSDALSLLSFGARTHARSRALDKREAEFLLRRKLGEYRNVAYPDLVARIGTDDHATVAGASGVEYQLEVQVFWDRKLGGDIRVIAAIDDGGLRAFFPLTDSLLMAPDGTFVGEGSG